MNNYFNFNKENFINNLKSIIDKNVPLVSNLSNISRLIYNTFKNVSWSGFYLVNEKGDLYLGPYQGELACTYIYNNKGVCGKSLYRKEVIIVDNVHLFEGHIACSSSTNSEIVVPLIKDDKVVGVIDLDSEQYSAFDENDKKLLIKASDIISKLF